MRFVWAVALAVLVTPALFGQARAFDFFGLFGSEEALPQPTQQTLPYDLQITGVDDKTLLQTLKDASNTWALRRDPPPSGDGLVRRAAADFPRLAEALWAAGYYNADVRMTVAGRALAVDGDNRSAASAAETQRGRQLVPLTVAVSLGPMFHLREVRVFDARTNQPLAADLIRRRGFPLKAGDEASANNIRAGAAAAVDYLREESRPLAKMVSIAPVVEHPLNVVDLAISIDPSEKAGFGPVTVQGTQNVPASVVQSFIYLQPGEPYYPRRLTETRKSISKIDAIGSVRIDEADHLDANGNLPLDVTVSERKRHAVGASASYSTFDGPSLRAWWMDRNLFGGAERLRIDAELGFAAPTGGQQFRRIKTFDAQNIVGRLKASFIKPALGGTRNDLLIDTGIQRERTNSYWSMTAGGTISIRHRFTEYASVQLGIDAERGRVQDILGTTDYTLVGFQAAANYDSTDDLLNPTRGIRVTASVSPYAKAFGSTLNLIQSKAQVTAYYALDEDARYILAGRVNVGSLAGSNLLDIPANHRFFAGGGGSVRGFRYRYLSPLGPFGVPIGGRSLFEASAEARIKITDTIGIVPFVDAGNAFASSLPDFKGGIRVAAGLGLRYFTAIGPVRIDFAMPLNRKPDDPRFGVYVGLGQAF
ncbi:MULTISPECIES: autotransporter assembly complex family protein [unclassified Beijerinckia]|uniref:autotransporter assembly complex protein TamA n=1 Tax=unclassified Beijerinckia TaxID=2638183 RepID=UPI00089C1BB5|nr:MULTISPECIES: autotransporter assembly complex family protein [unclassified Beijerinckia]MDH7795160.1 translocation and assembly module TamA [Beijerinckia sp. GAS462]SEB90040.1 autotransporter secretion outer membrane protein TamA [Beijerinckia sp. 28-YEA-48]